ncbi:MAG TPA: hypothetical protein VKA84_19930 [Gemmatimonadaceae bacterium]|nr:hypothetical protein [Gemmatimonadaceae bacterium]
MRKLGCLVLLLVLAAAAYLTRGRWMHLLGGRGAAEAPAAAAEVAWEALTPEGAERARRAVASLGGRGGPVFVNVGPGDLASYIFVQVAKQLPPSAQDVQAAVIGERLYLRANVSLRDLGGSGSLGPLASMLGDRETMQIGGQFEVLRPGLAQFRVQEVKLRDFALPQRAIPRVIGQIRKGAVPQGVTPDGLALEVPRHIGDVRVSRGKVTLYKST